MILDMPCEERPRERFLAQGGTSLSTAELIAIILGKGAKGKSSLTLATELLSRFGSPRELVKASIQELMEVKGIGQAKAIALKSCFELGLRSQKPDGIFRYPIYCPEDVYRYVRNQFEGMELEHMLLVLRDGRGCVFHQEQVAMGRKNCVYINVRDLFTCAIRKRAEGFFLCHNHPTGDPTPSKQDVELTHKLEKASQAIGIPFCDHLIIGQNDFRSLYRKNHLPKRKVY